MPENKHLLLDTTNRDNNLGPFLLAMILGLIAAIGGTAIVSMFR